LQINNSGCILQRQFPRNLPTNSINPSLVVPLWQFSFSNSFPFSNLPSAKKKKTLQQSPSSNFPSVKKPLIKKPFSESFKSSSKQGGGAAVLRKGHGTEQEKLVFLLLNNLGKAAELHLAFSLSSAAGAVPNLSLQII
jgi:hypothetical protein